MYPPSSFKPLNYHLIKGVRNTNFNTKEKYIIRNFREKFEKRAFDEIDVCFFVILLRSHLDKNEFPYICDFGDSIAHRERDRGKAFDSIKNSKDNEYKTQHDSKKLIGYDGIDNELWKREWMKLGQKLSIHYSDIAINELLLCYISSMQFSQFENLGEMRIVISEKDISLATAAKTPSSPYASFAVLKNVDFKTPKTSRLVENAVFTIRKNNELQLIDESGERIL